MKKRMMALLMVLCFAVPTITALAVQGEVNLFTDEDTRPYVEGVTSIGDTIYMISDKGLYSWNQKLKEPQLLSDKVSSRGNYSGVEWFLAGEEGIKEETVQQLFENQGKLYGLSQGNGEIFEIVKKEEEYSLHKVSTLDVKVMASDEEENYGFYAQSAVGYEGKLFLIIEDMREDGDGSYALYSFDIENGQGEKVGIEDIIGISPYKEGKMLGLQFNQGEAYREYYEKNQGEGERPAPMLGIIDFENNHFEPIEKLPVSEMTGLVYHEKDQGIYLAGNGRIWKWTKEKGFEEGNYIPINDSWRSDPGMILDGDLYAVAVADGGTYVRSIDPAHKAQGILTLEGAGPYLEEVKVFEKERPEIPLVFKEYEVESENFSAKIMMGDDSVDIYRTEINHGQLSILKEKGYLTDLSGSEILSQSVKTMYPQIQKTVMDKEGKLVAYPGDMYVNTMGYVQPVFDNMNLEVPKNWEDLFALYGWWGEEYGETFNGEYYLTMNTYIKGNPATKELLSKMITDYENHQLKTQGKIRFNTPLFKELIEGFEKHKTQIELIVDPDGGRGVSWDDYPPYLIEEHYAISPPGSMMKGMDYLPLKLTEGEEIITEGALSVFVINPHSKNKELAMTFLETIAQNLPPRIAKTFNPNDNEPVINERYIEDQKTMEEDMVAFEKMLEVAKEDEKQGIQEEITWRKEHLEKEKDSDWKWIISPKGLEEYRKFEGKWDVFPDSPLLIGDIATFKEEQIEKYLKEEITSDQLISQLDQRIEMIEMENQ